MDRKLIDYLPPVLREVLELKAINEANEPEISLAWDALALVMANQFLEEADERGVAMWEKELRIQPRDTDTLTTRKDRVKAMWNRKPPYTIRWLERWLDGIYGQANHEEIVEDYTLRIQLDHTEMPSASRLSEEILKTLAEVLPSNLCLLLEFILKFPAQDLCVGGAMASIISMPVPERADIFHFEDTVRAGGTMAAVFTIHIPENTTSTTSSRTGRVGVKGAVTTTIPLPEMP